ncbi:hypothetical protein EV715DRAFT_206217 [Schizophyllum commune]
MTAVPDIDMTPKGLVNDDGNYVLQHEDIANLLKYVWSGVLLPVTVSAYQDRLELSMDTINQLSDVIKPLLAAYGTAQQNCKKFKDETYPGIVDLSNDVFAYAQNAGGTVDNSNYGMEAIDAVINQQAEDIERLQMRAAGAVADLKYFESLTRTDQVKLGSRNSALKSKLVAELGSLEDLDLELDRYRREISADVDECQRNRVAAQTTAAYAWVFPIGTILAAINVSNYTSTADVLEQRINEVQDLIAKGEQKKKDETRLIADLTAIETDLKGVQDKIQPSIKVLETMQGVWSAIAGDLNTIKELLEKDFKLANEAVAKLQAKKLVNDWNELKVAVDKYRQVAYVADVPSVSMDDYVAQLNEARK